MLGENIKEARQNANMSRAKLSEKVGVSVGMISFYERNIYRPRIGTLAKIAEALCVNVSDLIAENEKTLSLDELAILEMYREMNEDGKEQAFKQLNIMLASGLYRRLK